MVEVVILGAGNVATNLYRTFSQAENLEVKQVYNRNEEHLDFVENHKKRISQISKLQKADLYILAVSDEAINEIAPKLLKDQGLVVHSSGSQPMDLLSEFNNFGVFYPLQTFSKDKPVDFKEIPLCLEANSEENLKYLKNIAAELSDQVFEVNSEQRKALHVSAVFVNNFTNHLFTLAADYCKENDLPFKILQPLIRETVSKIDILPPFSAQTGPALRNDQKTISAHLKMLDEDRKKIYTVLTESIQKLHGKKL